MTTLRCVVVDDEPLARELMRTMLAAHPDVEVVAEYADGDAALAGIREQGPDLVFLDIRMPGASGFDVVQRLDAWEMPAVVFVTAYDQYAVRAFEVHALDYLLKPFDPPRLARALDRAREALTRPDREEESERIRAVLQGIRRRERMDGLIAIREGDRTYLQAVEEIDWIEAEAKYMRIHVGTKSYAMRETMRSLESRLDPARFLRVSRSAIVNLHRVREIQPWFNGELVLILRNGVQVTTTRAYRDQLGELIGR